MSHLNMIDLTARELIDSTIELSNSIYWRARGLNDFKAVLSKGSQGLDSATLDFSFKR